MLYRLRTNFRLSIITLLGACAFFGIAPFAIYRFYSGEILWGLIDLAIIGGCLGMVLYAWISNRTQVSGVALAIVACSGGVVVASIQGTEAIFWTFPTFVTSFLLATPATAVLINSAAILSLALPGIAFDSHPQMLSFVASSIVVSACAYVFARQNEHQRQQLQNLATFDFLTGVKNRRAMDRALQIAAATYSRTGLPQALVILDLDHFKQVNDVHGHSVGDEVLVQCARLVEQNIRQADQLFRFGGEEFVILLTGAKEGSLQSIILNLRRQLALNLKGPDGPVTASFGAAVLKDEENWEEWLARADAALYRAKNSGRDCVVLYDLEGQVLR